VREDFDPLNMQQRNAPRWEASVELRRHGQPNRVDGIKTWISQTKPTKGRLASLLASSSFLLPLLLLLQAVTKVDCVEAQASDLSPSVSATCSQGFMRVKLRTGQPFHGVIHARDSRDNACLTYGTGRTTTFLTVNLLTPVKHKAFCGVSYNNATEESQVALAVRTHRTLELAGDNFYVITCGRSGWRDSQTNETSAVKLELVASGRKVTEATYGREYQLQAMMDTPSEKYGLRVRNCFAFSDKNSSVRLLNDKGCPERSVLSQFVSESLGVSTATLYSMFRFPDSNTVHLQCDILVCAVADCAETLCVKDPQTDSRSVASSGSGAREEEEHRMMASTTVFVLEPGVTALAATGDCELGPSWLLWLCVVFGVLFLVMLCVNVFLCSAMTCSFSRAEVELVDEKAGSVYTVQDYDPYRSWAGSQYGSRFSLDHPGTRPLSAGPSLGPEHPGTRLATPSMQYTSLQSKPYSNSRPSSRNGKYSNGVAGGGYPGIQNMAYSPAYSNGVTSMSTSLGRPAPAVYQPPATPSRSRTPVRTPRSRARARHRAREAGQFDLAPDQYSLHSRPASQTGSYRNAVRAARAEERV